MAKKEDRYKIDVFIQWMAESVNADAFKKYCAEQVGNDAKCTISEWDALLEKFMDRWGSV